MKQCARRPGDIAEVASHASDLSLSYAGEEGISGLPLFGAQLPQVSSESWPVPLRPMVVVTGEGGGSCWNSRIRF